jgi:hypothetical protein
MRCPFGERWNCCGLHTGAANRTHRQRQVALGRQKQLLLQQIKIFFSGPVECNSETD